MMESGRHLWAVIFVLFLAGFVRGEGALVERAAQRLSQMKQSPPRGKLPTLRELKTVVRGKRVPEKSAAVAGGNSSDRPAAQIRAPRPVVEAAAVKAAEMPKRSPAEQQQQENDHDKVMLNHFSKVMNNFLKFAHNPEDEDNLRESMAGIAGNVAAFIIDGVRRGILSSEPDEWEVKECMSRGFNRVMTIVKHRRSMLQQTAATTT